jgi:hypothetical protein
MTINATELARKAMAEMSAEALACMEEAGVRIEEVTTDIEQYLRHGDRNALYELCMDGAEPDRERVWRDYVATIVRVASWELALSEVARQDAEARNARSAARKLDALELRELEEYARSRYGVS